MGADSEIADARLSLSTILVFELAWEASAKQPAAPLMPHHAASRSIRGTLIRKLSPPD
jgi:hypothetical protein